MIPSPFTKLTLFFSALFSLLVIGLIYVFSIVDDRTKVVFCDVGQGDAAYIRINNQTDILIDSGPDDKVLSCLGKHMPFYDRKIELAILSHPQKDHYGGFLQLIDRYQISRLIIPLVDNNADQQFIRLKQKLTTNKIPLSILKAGDLINMKNAKLFFFWPTKNFLNTSLVFDKPRLVNNVVLGASGLDSNYFSSVFSLQIDNFRLLFTGDAPGQVLNRLPEKNKLKTTVLKIPHHGSKNGLTKKFLLLADPTVTVINVGKNNSYGHPSKEVLDMLKAMNIKIRRTDLEGDIVFKINSNFK